MRCHSSPHKGNVRECWMESCAFDSHLLALTQTLVSVETALPHPSSNNKVLFSFPTGVVPRGEPNISPSPNGNFQHYLVVKKCPNPPQYLWRPCGEALMKYCSPSQPECFCWRLTDECEFPYLSRSNKEFLHQKLDINGHWVGILGLYAHLAITWVTHFSHWSGVRGGLLKLNFKWDPEINNIMVKVTRIQLKTTHQTLG